MQRNIKALFAIQSRAQDEIYIRLMNYNTPKEAWNALKEEFQGNERTKQMQVLNLRRNLRSSRLKTQTIKEYIDKLMKVANQIRMLGEELTERRIVEKVLVSVPERFKAKRSSLEYSKYLTKLTLTELVNALQAQEHRRAMRMEELEVEACLLLHEKKTNSYGRKKQFGEKNERETYEREDNKEGTKKGKYPLALIANKEITLQTFVGGGQM